MSSYPVSFSVARPAGFARFHVLVRLLVFAVLGLFGMSLGWTFLLAMLVLPAFAAVRIAKADGAGYLLDDSPAVARVLRWMLAFYAYVGLLTDELPDARYAEHVEFHVLTTGAPTVSSALWRLVRALPALVFLALLGIPAALAWVVAMVLVAVTGDYPTALFDLQVGVLRYTARLLAWHASLVDLYPPFSLRAEPDQVHDDLAHPRAA